MRKYGKRRMVKRRRVGGTSRRIKRVENRVKKIVSGIETKQFTSNFVSNAGNFPASVFSVLLNSIANSSSVNGRIGQTYRITSINLNYACRLDPGVPAQDAFTSLRVMVIKHKQWNNTPVFPPSYYLENWNSLYNITAQYSWNNRNAFRVLYDKVHFLNQNFMEEKSKSIRLRLNTTVQCSTPGSMPVDISQNAIWLLIYSDSTVAPNPEVFGTWRVKFQDD